MVPLFFEGNEGKIFASILINEFVFSISFIEICHVVTSGFIDRVSPMVWKFTDSLFSFN